MAGPARRIATYADVLAAPDHMIAEIVDGELVLSPRPAKPHTAAASALGEELGPPFKRGRGGPGGWIIVDEPELHLGSHVLVPDLGGWRRERMPAIVADAAYFTLAPDWVCELRNAFNSPRQPYSMPSAGQGPADPRDNVNPGATSNHLPPVIATSTGQGGCVGTRPDAYSLDENGLKAEHMAEVCEVISPRTEIVDRVRKRRIYGEQGVAYLWFVDPIERLLEIFKNKDGTWFLAGSYEGSEKVHAEPFEAIELDLSILWADVVLPEHEAP